MNYSVEMIGIRKEYPGVVANNNVTVNFEKGSVTCLVGENGAGKTTLMNILYGLEQPTSGEIKINGNKVLFSSSRDAIRNKIGMVHQHFMLVNELSVLENVILGMEPKKGFRLDYKEAKRSIEDLGKKYNMEMPIYEKTSNLAVGVQQKVEIVKTLYRGADILIFDEPTAVLTPQETEELFNNIRLLAKNGKTIILITHKLNEVMRIADNIIVMRRGEVVTELKSNETNAGELAVHMVGKALPAIQERKKSGNESVLELKDISVKEDNGIYSLKNINASVFKGEILGIAGVSGNGQSQLAQVIAGLINSNSGKIELNGNDVTKHSRRMRLLDGISYVPEDRKKTGLCLPWSIAENVIAGYHIKPELTDKFGFMKEKKINELAKDVIKKFDVRTFNHLTSVGSLSGGNQQKVVIARETMNDPKLIIAAEPTRGVDIGAISFIYNYLIDMRNNGTAVLLISSDLDEIFKLSDRIAVMYKGQIAAIVNPGDISREELGLYMAGVQKGENAG